MADLLDYLAALSLDPGKLATYLRNPYAALTRAGVPKEQIAALRTGNQADLWQLLLTGQTPTTPPPGDAPPDRDAGTLTVIGTGIRTTGQLTVETIAWMRTAEELLYLVADPISERLITTLNPKALSLRGYYGENSARIDSYEAMVEHILSCVRAGKRTVAAFYGHPGVFAYPSHESIRRARMDGYTAIMLPGVSAEDCLYADLGIDPCVSGTQIYEATDFLVHERTIDTSSQLILWQVGVVGDLTYKLNGYDLRGFPLLVQRLAEFYPLTQEVTVYEAAVFLGFAPRIQRLQLGQLTADYVNASTTMYIPPARATIPSGRMQNALRVAQQPSA
ncbi:SAM-dependent methyltransferase [Cumulibacter manganitolerans]|uniref:SAM-dependent methyltransferase n=1 Tax=Cumulibacter manganitolerans TaxID=1884992 RepID=UPI0012961393|nr:SAM-dependent methyltransferase [Cumulibacter manganitolerans]